METHAAADFAERTVVERVDSSSEEPGKYGVVVRRDHKMVRVDFSMSGGKASQWVGYTDLRIVDDVLNLSNASDCPSDPGSGGGGSSAGCKQVLTISDVNNARFCKRCNEGFELLTKDTCCPGGHPNYLWTKDVPDHINLIQVTSASSHPARTVPPQDASSGVGLAPVMEDTGGSTGSSATPANIQVQVSDIDKVRFCKSCNLTFELLGPDTKCAGSHPNFMWTKRIPQHIELQVTATETSAVAERTEDVPPPPVISRTATCTLCGDTRPLAMYLPQMLLGKR